MNPKVNNFLAKAIVFALLIMLALPASTSFAAYTVFPGQSVAIQHPGQSSPMATIILASLDSLGAQSLSVSLFEKSYSIDVSAAQIKDKNQGVGTLQNLAVGDRVNVSGFLDANNSFLIHAQLVRTPLKAFGVTLPPSPGTPSSTPNTPGPEEAVANELYNYLKTGIPASTTNPAVQTYLWDRPITEWNRTTHSQNLPLIAEAATGNYRFFADLANLETREGLYGREFGSPGFYFSYPFVAKMTALRDARRAGDTVAATAIQKNLEAIITMWSLVAVPSSRTSELINVGGRTLTGTGNAPTFQGLTVAVAGERWHTGGIVRDEESLIIPWALEVSPRRMPAGGEVVSLRSSAPGPKRWNNMIALLTGTDKYTDPTTPEVWGLTAESRQKLKSITQGNTSNVSGAVGLLQQYGLWAESPVRIRRTSLGTEMVFFNSSNGNKPAEAVTSVTNDGVWKSMRPCDGDAGNANPGYQVSIANGVIAATGNSTRCATATQPELGGTILYEIMIRGRSVTAGAHQPLPPSGSNPTSTAVSSGPAYDLINHLLDLRKDTKDKGFSWLPHERLQIPVNLAKMQKDVLDLFPAVSPFNSSQATRDALAKVPPAYTEFSIACLAPALVSPGHVDSGYKRGLEITGGRLNDVLIRLRDSLPPPPPGSGNGGPAGDSGGDGGGSNDPNRFNPDQQIDPGEGDPIVP